MVNRSLLITIIIFFFVFDLMIIQTFFMKSKWGEQLCSAAERDKMEVEITSPAQYSHVYSGRIMVEGTIEANDSNIGITVNGLVADKLGNRWVVNDLPVTASTEKIKAVARDIEGNEATDEIHISVTNSGDSVELSASSTSGVQPFETSFYIKMKGLNTIRNVQIDFEGDGSFDYQGTDIENINHVYDIEGIFYPSVRVVSKDGQTYDDKMAITVLDQEEIDKACRGTWGRMRKALKNSGRR